MQFGKFWVSTIFANQRSQRQSVALQGGSNTQPFQVKSDEYEENRHFLLAQYFRDNYNNSMKNLPIINTQVQLLRLRCLGNKPYRRNNQYQGYCWSDGPWRTKPVSATSGH